MQVGVIDAASPHRRKSYLGYFLAFAFWLIGNQAAFAAVNVNPSTLPAGTQGVLYDETLTGSGGTGPTHTGNCNNLECQQTMCMASSCNVPACGELEGPKTTLSGYIYDPAGNVPLYNVAVYVPNQALAAVPEGLSCQKCDGTASGQPIASECPVVNAICGRCPSD